MVSKFKSIFKSKKAVEEVVFPKPPNRRQMTEDIERLSGDDPLMLFAELLYSRAASFGQDGTNTHAFSSTFATKKGTLSSPRLSHSVSVPDSPAPELAEAALKDARSKINPTSAPVGLKNPISANNVEPGDDSETFHRKLKQMSLACNKTRELVLYLESKLKDLEVEFSEFTAQIESAAGDIDDGDDIKLT